MGIMLGFVWLVTTVAPVFREVAAESVRIRTFVRASVYTYQVTNHGAEPITRFEVPYGDGYYFQVPEGWQKDDGGNVFRAWTDQVSSAIQPHAAGTFSFRVTSRGAVLGLVPARVVRASGVTVTVPDVWGAVPEPHSHVLLVTATVAAIGGLHAWLATHAESCDSGAS